MIDTADSTALERLLRPLRSELDAEFAAALLRMRVDEELQSRYDDLAQRHTEHDLTPAELSELASLVRLNSLLSVLKAEAYAYLQHSPAL